MEQRIDFETKLMGESLLAICATPTCQFEPMTFYLRLRSYINNTVVVSGLSMLCCMTLHRRHLHRTFPWIIPMGSGFLQLLLPIDSSNDSKGLSVALIFQNVVFNVNTVGLLSRFRENTKMEYYEYDNGVIRL